MKPKNSTTEDIRLSDLEIDRESVEYELDEDICSESELEQKFSVLYHLACQKAINLNKDYILEITGDSESKTIGCALSDKSCSIHKLTESSIVQINDFKCAHSKRITNIQFSPTNNQILYSGSLDGTIQVWDLRQQRSVRTLEDLTNGHTKPITCFDITVNDRLLCAGTESIGGDAFLLFWDARKSNLLGGYWQSHTDDITKVRFHKHKEDLLASSSTDGLVNVYDISEDSEHKALIHTLNTESSVDKIDWYKCNNGIDDAIYCITHTECIGLWNIEDGDFYKKYSRDEISLAMFKKSKEDVYVANVHDDGDTGQLFIVAGSNKGRAECLRTLEVNKNDGCITPRSLLIGNRQIVRSTWFDSKNKILISGGECSILSVWQPGSESGSKATTRNTIQSSDSNSKPLKNTSKLKNKMKPY